MNYLNIIEIVRKRLESAHDIKKESIRKKFFLAEYDFFKKNIKNKKVLVAGSGLGHDSLEIAKNNKEVIGVELIKEYVEIAREKAKKEGVKNVNFQQGEFRKLSYKDEYFDVAVLNMGTIGDFKDKSIILSELLRVAKVVYFDFYPYTKKGLKIRKKMYEEEKWKNIRIDEEKIISDDGLYSESISKEEIEKIVRQIKAKVKFYEFCDFSIMAELTK